jgi:hypothetical protein
VALPHVFNTQPAGNVPAQYLDDNFNALVTSIAAVIVGIQNGTYTYCGAATGTANAITLTPSQLPAALQSGQSWGFTALATNSGAVQVNVGGTGLINLMKRTNLGYTALVAGDIVIGLYHSVTYDGTQYVLDFVFGAGGAAGSGSFLTNQFFPYF